MSEQTDPLETLWEHLLSRNASLVNLAYQSLSTEEQVAVLAHLHRMVNDPGWHPEQRLSAQSALEYLEPIEGWAP